MTGRTLTALPTLILIYWRNIQTSCKRLTL
jgi:hypothetical protein